MKFGTIVVLGVSCVGCTARSGADDSGPADVVTISGTTTSAVIDPTVTGTAVLTGISVISSVAAPMIIPPSSSLVTPSPPTVSEAAIPAAMRPVLVVRLQSTGASCADQHTAVPKLVIYGDGRVVRTVSDGFGQYCAPVPTFRVGLTDVALIRRRVESYLSTKASTVDMTQAPVADAGLTVLEYTGSDGRQRTVAAVAINYGLDGLKTDQRDGRIALTAVIADLNKLAPTTEPWTPITISVTKPAKWVPRYSSTEATPWPVPVSSAVLRVVLGGEGSCTAVTGSAAGMLLTAARARTSAAATWEVGGRPIFLAVGVVLDGFIPCG